MVVFCGGMAEWSKAAVLKTVERKFRGFESYSLRQFLTRKTGLVNAPKILRRGDREAEGARLLSECGVSSSTEGSNPSLSAII